MERLRRRRSHKEEGFTLVELVIAFGLLAFGLVAVMSVIGQSFVAVSSNDDTVSAIKEAQIILNTMRGTAATVVTFPADVVTAFPPGTLNPPRANLVGEVVQISYEDPLATPLQVTVQVQYLGSAGRPLNVSLSTAVGNL